MNDKMATPDMSAPLSLLVFWNRARELFVRGLSLSCRTAFQAWLCASLCGLCVGCLQAATPLDVAISSLTIAVTNLQTSVSKLSTDQATLIAKLHAVDTGQCALWVAGAGTNGSFPISFIPSKTGVAGVQADLLIPSSFTVTGVSIGSAGTTAAKQVAFSQTGNVEHLIVFGLNQTTIGQGVLATVSYTTTAPKGFYPLVLTNPVASDPNGNTVPLCVTSGGVSL